MDRNHNLNLTSVPKELKLILEILKVGKKENQQIDPYWKSQKTELDWTLFINMVMHHRVYPILYHYLKKIDTFDIIPSYIIKELSILYKFNTFQMLQLRGEMELVGAELSRKELKVIFLKGPVLALDLYGEISLRTSCDLDILVPIDELEKTEEILLAFGYKKDDYIKSILGDWKWRHHHFTYHHPVKNIKIEVHWRLNPGPGKEPSFNVLWGRKRKIKDTVNHLYYLGREDLLFFLITHGSRHGWSRLRWLMDIDRLLEQNINWKSSYKIFKKYHYLNTGGQAFHLSKQLFNSEIPESVDSMFICEKSRRLSQDVVYYIEQMVNLHSESVPDTVAKYHKRYLMALMSFQNKLMFFLSCLYPYPTDLETFPLPKNLHLLYFALRPFLWIWRKTRSHALS